MKSCLAQAAALLLALAAGRAFAMEFGALYGLGSRTWRRQAQRERELAMAANQNSHATTHFFTDAKVDHFGSIESSRDLTWRQRFHVDSTHWGGSGSPVFLYIGGEGTASPPSDSMFMGELAKEHKALMLVLEHRYYGESRPVEDMTTPNLRFLSSHQALADLMWFISWVKTASPDLSGADPPLHLPGSARKSPWVAFGGSYPGNLAAWLKVKYPHLLVGSVASSGPVQAEYNFEQYAQVVGSALLSPPIGGSLDCFDRVEKAVVQLRHLVTSTAPYGAGEGIPKALKPCSPMANDMDLTAYEAELFGNFQGTVQYNGEGSAPTVSDLCSIMTNTTASPLQAFASVADLFRPAGDGEGCVSSSFQEDIVAPLSVTDFSGRGCADTGSCSMERQWIYQSCQEFGFFQTTTGDHHPFRAFSSLTIINAGAEICKAAYGIQVSPWVEWSNAAYGGRAVEGINITLVNGSMDPWHSLGVINSTSPFYNSCTDHCTQQELSSTEDVVFMEGTSHCRDMYGSNSDKDPESVKWAHKKIRAAVGRYLGVSSAAGWEKASIELPVA